LRSRPFAWSGTRRVDEAIRCRQLWAVTSRRTTRPTPFQRRGCELPLAFLGPRGAFTEPCRPSDALLVTRKARPTGLCADRCAVRDTLLADGATEIDLRARGLRFAAPVKERRAGARERLPSYREPASRNPQVEFARPWLSFALFRAPFRLLSARALRQAVLRVSSRLASWLATRPCDLPADKTRDAYDRLLPPERLTCTRTPYVPDSLPRLSPRGRPTESKAPYGLSRDQVLHGT